MRFFSPLWGNSASHSVPRCLLGSRRRGLKPFRCFKFTTVSQSAEALLRDLVPMKPIMCLCPALKGRGGLAITSAVSDPYLSSAEPLPPLMESWSDEVEVFASEIRTALHRTLDESDIGAVVILPPPDPSEFALPPPYIREISSALAESPVTKDECRPRRIYLWGDAENATQISCWNDVYRAAAEDREGWEEIFFGDDVAMDCYDSGHHDSGKIDGREEISSVRNFLTRSWKGDILPPPVTPLPHLAATCSLNLFLWQHTGGWRGNTFG